MAHVNLSRITVAGVAGIIVHGSAPITRMTRALTSPTSFYVQRTLLAMIIALYAALFLQLATPSSAAVTVMIVAHPARGAILSKGLWRIFGTLTGAVASVVIIACFAQSSLLFLTAFSFWLGACVFVSSMFRHFRSYAAVLSGYTVALIAFGALADPINIVLLALSRLAVVTIGVTTSTVVTMIFQPGISKAAVMSGAMAAIRGVAKLVHDCPAGMDEASFQSTRSALVGQIERLDETVEFAGVEAFSVSRHAPSLRRGFAALYAALITVATASRSLASLAVQATEDDAMRETSAKVETVLLRIAATNATDATALTELTDAVAETLADLASLQKNALSALATVTIARLHQELSYIHSCVAVLAAWQSGQAPYYGSAPLASFRDYAAATRNALRAITACMLGGLFWYSSAWNSGSQLLLFLGLTSALLSAAPSPAAASVEFAKGALVSIPASFIVGFLLLPHASGFPALIIAMLPFLTLSVFGSTRPRYALSSLAFTIFFITGTALANQMTYNFGVFVNTALATVVGAGASVLAYRILLPPDPVGDARHLVRGIRRVIEGRTRGARSRYDQDPLGWQIPANQRLQRLFMRLQVQPSVRLAAIADSGALLIIAQEILQLRATLRSLPLPDGVSAYTGAAMLQLRTLRETGKVQAAAVAASAALSTLNSAALGAQPEFRRAADRFRTIATLMPEAARLLALETSLGTRS